MRFVLSLSILALATAAGCATQKPTGEVTQAPEGATCKNLTSNGKTEVYCGTSQQWAELDRRVRAINSGVTCRWARTPQETCLTAEQWARVDQNERDRAQAGFSGGIIVPGGQIRIPTEYKPASDFQPRH